MGEEFKTRLMAMAAMLVILPSKMSAELLASMVMMIAETKEMPSLQYMGLIQNALDEMELAYAENEKKS